MGTQKAAALKEAERILGFVLNGELKDAEKDLAQAEEEFDP